MGFVNNNMESIVALLPVFEDEEDRKDYAWGYYKPTKREEDTYIELIAGEQGVKFIKKYGSPKKLFFINIVSYPGFGSAYFKIYERRKSSYSKWTSYLQGPWLETENEKAISLDDGKKGLFNNLSCFKRQLFDSINKITPRLHVTLDQSLFTGDNFDSLITHFPLFDRSGNCRYVANIDKQKIDVPFDTMVLEQDYASKFLEGRV